MLLSCKSFCKHNPIQVPVIWNDMMLIWRQLKKTPILNHYRYRITYRWRLNRLRKTRHGMHETTLSKVVLRQLDCAHPWVCWTHIYHNNVLHSVNSAQQANGWWQDHIIHYQGIYFSCTNVNDYVKCIVCTDDLYSYLHIVKAICWYETSDSSKMENNRC